MSSTTGDFAYTVIVKGLEKVWATGRYPGKFSDIDADDIARCYARVTADCRTWRGDATWTIDRDASYVRSIDSLPARAEYLAKIAHWWRKKGRTILRIREDQLADPVIRLPVVIAKLIDSYYVDSIARSFGVYARVNELLAELDTMDPFGHSDGIDDEDAAIVLAHAHRNATTAIVSEETAARFAAMDPNDSRYGRVHFLS